MVSHYGESQGDYDAAVRTLLESPRAQSGNAVSRLHARLLWCQVDDADYVPLRDNVLVPAATRDAREAQAGSGDRRRSGRAARARAGAGRRRPGGGRLAGARGRGRQGRRSLDRAAARPARESRAATPEPAAEVQEARLLHGADERCRQRRGRAAVDGASRRTGRHRARTSLTAEADRRTRSRRARRSRRAGSRSRAEHRAGGDERVELAVLAARIDAGGSSSSSASSNARPANAAIELRGSTQVSVARRCRASIISSRERAGVALPQREHRRDAERARAALAVRANVGEEQIAEHDVA